VLTAEELDRARELFEEVEPRDLFYRVAIELIDLARRGDTGISEAEALAVLLQTWNRRFYVAQFRGRFPKEHFEAIEALLTEQAAVLSAVAERPIEGLADADRPMVEALFAEFEAVLRPVGAVKALHLLAPRFFPLWDGEIAKGKGCAIGDTGTNARRYWRFMQIALAECRELGGEGRWGPGLLKRLDELNYCRYTRRLEL
jgi:hypothetical protein